MSRKSPKSNKTIGLHQIVFDFLRVLCLLYGIKTASLACCLLHCYLLHSKYMAGLHILQLTATSLMGMSGSGACNHVLAHCMLSCAKQDDSQ